MGRSNKSTRSQRNTVSAHLSRVRTDRNHRYYQNRLKKQETLVNELAGKTGETSNDIKKQLKEIQSHKEIKNDITNEKSSKLTADEQIKYHERNERRALTNEAKRVRNALHAKINRAIIKTEIGLITSLESNIKNLENKLNRIEFNSNDDSLDFLQDSDEKVNEVEPKSPTVESQTNNNDDSSDFLQGSDEQVSEVEPKSPAVESQTNNNDPDEYATIIGEFSGTELLSFLGLFSSQSLHPDPQAAANTDEDDLDFFEVLNG